MTWRITVAALAAPLALGSQGCHRHASPTPNAEQAPNTQQAPSAPPSARESPGPPAAGSVHAPPAASTGTRPGTLVVQTQDLTAPMPGAVLSKLDVQATPGGLVVEMIEGLACDGSWKWRARRAGSRAITIELSDENHSSMRTSCASMVHQRVTVSGLAPGAYHVHVAMPTGYSSLDRTVTVAH